MRGPLGAALDLGTFRDEVPHRPGILLEEFGLLQGHLVFAETIDALPRILIRNLDTARTGSLPRWRSL